MPIRAGAARTAEQKLFFKSISAAPVARHLPVSRITHGCAHGKCRLCRASSHLSWMLAAPA